MNIKDERGRCEASAFLCGEWTAKQLWARLKNWVAFVCGGNGELMIKVAMMPSFFMITNDFMYIFINFTADSMYIVWYNSSVKKEGDVYATKY